MKVDYSKTPTPVVVSGVGIVSPLGTTSEITWRNLIEGRSGIEWEEGASGTERTQGHLLAVVKGVSPNGAHSRMGDFAILAAKEALANAGFPWDTVRGMNIGCSVSQSKPPLSNEFGSYVLGPQLLLSSFSHWSCDTVVRRTLGLTGPAINVVAACATGVASIQQGVHWIQSGMCDVVLAGAAESSLNPLYLAGFENMGTLSPGHHPSDICPFDENRSGFAVGEGAAVLVLEREDVCRRRGRRSFAKVRSVRMMQTPVDSIQFDETGLYVGRLIQCVMASSDLPDYINAHGTGTKLNDLQETNGIKNAFGPQARNIPVSTTKAATGHLLGAAGALEAAFCVMSLREQIIPPTLNLNHPDPKCDLDYVPHMARRGQLKTALSLSYGFGGQMGAVLFEKGY